LEIFDITPDFSTDKVRQKKKFSLVKAKEILAWLEQHDNIDKYIVLEDLDLHNNIIGQQQIQTNNLVGLTKEDVSNAIQRLNA
jgi:hypothetical protein